MLKVEFILAPQASASSEPGVSSSAGDYRKSVTIPTSITTPRILPYIRGYAYSAPYNTRLIVSIDASNNLVYSVWSNSIFLGADATLIIYDASDFTISTTGFGPSADVHANYGSTPITTTTQNVNFASYSKTPVLFFGLSTLDMWNEKNYSLEENVVTGAQLFTVSYIAAQATRMYAATNTALLSCITSVKDCLVCAQGFYLSAPGTCAGKTLLCLYMSNISFD